MKRATLAMASLMLISCPALGQQPSPGDIAAPTEPVDGGFIVGGGGEWEFMMGPSGSPDMVARLMRSSPQGAVGFSCHRRDGSMQAAVSSDHLLGSKGSAADIMVRVSEAQNMLPMAIKEDPLPDRPPVWEYSGPGVPAILESMGSTPVWRRDGLAFSNQAGNGVEFALVYPRSSALQMASVCRGWAEAALHLALPSSAVEPTVSAISVQVQAASGETVLLPGVATEPPNTGINPAAQR